MDSKTPSGVFFGIPLTPYAVVGSLEDAWLERVTTMLMEIGCECDRIRDTASVLPSFTTREPDLILVDGGLHGALDLCRKIKSRASTNGIPFVLRGGEGSDEHARRRAIEAGCDHWLSASEPALQETRSRILHLLRWRGLLHSLFESQDHLRQRRDWVRYLVHDLRNPLTCVMAGVGFVSEKLGQAVDPDVSESLSDMEFQLQRMTAMLQDMLDIDRMQRQEMLMERVELNLSRLTQQAAADVRHLARRSGIEVTVEGPSACQIWADPSLTERMIANLMSNALKHARSRIRLVLAIEEDRASLRVSNDGKGIAEPMRERIFIPFVQAEHSRMGAGLGLAFCRMVATAHGGRIELCSGTDGDVCFALSLPRVQTK